jgi:uncharacterized protein (TIGR02217 family)
LFKIYEDMVLPYLRRITKPVEGSVKMYIDGTIVEAKVNYNTGIVVLPTSLTNGQVLATDFMFDVPVRFDSDSFSYSYHVDGSIELAPIELIEVFG